MGSDRARISYDEKQQYRSVVMQQGRVTLEADWNEAQQIAGEETREHALDFVGPAGTPDDGYAVTFPAGLPAFDFQVGAGTMYVGGERVALAAPLQYSVQSEWLDNAIDPAFKPLPGKAPGNEYIGLLLREQEISAVEDSDLKDVALGGPDTAQRTRLIQHVERIATSGTDCPSALAETTKDWAAAGLIFDPATMRLNSTASLFVDFPTAGGPITPCDPAAQSGYLGADNQLIRVQISSVDSVTGAVKLLWGFDDASFLYRVDVMDPQTLHLQSAPVDAEHQPQAGQAVEILMSAAKLSNGEYVAAPSGFVETLAASSYDPAKQILTLPAALPAVYGDGNASHAHPPRVFLRAWKQELGFTAGTALPLGDTGLTVTLQTSGSTPLRVGDYWMFAVRPGTPQQVYPERYHAGFQPPEGPREWFCPLAVIQWTGNTGSVLDNCRNGFDNLLTLTRRKTGGCCTVNVNPSDLGPTQTLQTILNKFSGSPAVTVCLMPGEYDLPGPLNLTSEHSNYTIEACSGGVLIRAADSTDRAFLQGLIVLNAANNVTIRGIDFQLPLPVLGDTTLASSGVSQIAPVVVSIGLRPVGCTGFTVENCKFHFSRTSGAGLVSTGILAGGDCVGLRLEDNQFAAPALSSRISALSLEFNNTQVSSLSAGFMLFPSTVSKDVPLNSVVRSGAAAQVVPAFLDSAIFRHNTFNGVAFATFVYADCGRVELESNTVRNCTNGFWFLTLPSMAFADNIQDISVAPGVSAKASNLQAALFTAVGHPAAQMAGAVLRGYPLPNGFDLSSAIPVTVQKVASTVKDATLAQNSFDQLLSVTPEALTLAEAKTKAVRLSTLESTLAAHPLPAVATTGFDVASLNQSYNVIEKQAFAQPVSRTVPVGLQFRDDEVNTLVSGSTSGLSLLVWILSSDDKSALSSTGGTYIGANGNLPVVLIAGLSRCSFTGNMVLNEASGISSNKQIPPSLWLFPLGVKSSITGATVAAAAVTGNVFRGRPVLPARNLNPKPPAPMDTWEFFNSES